MDDCGYRWIEIEERFKGVWKKRVYKGNAKGGSPIHTCLQRDHMADVAASTWVVVMEWVAAASFSPWMIGAYSGSRRSVQLTTLFLHRRGRISGWR